VLKVLIKPECEATAFKVCSTLGAATSSNACRNASYDVASNICLALIPGESARTVGHSAPHIPTRLWSRLRMCSQLRFQFGVATGSCEGDRAQLVVRDSCGRAVQVEPM